CGEMTYQPPIHGNLLPVTRYTFVCSACLYLRLLPVATNPGGEPRGRPQAIGGTAERRRRPGCLSLGGAKRPSGQAPEGRRGSPLDRAQPRSWTRLNGVFQSNAAVAGSDALNNRIR